MRREDAPLGVSNKGGAPFLDGSLLQEIGKASTDYGTWAFIAGSWPLDLVHSGGVYGSFDYLDTWDELEERGTLQKVISAIW